MWLNVYSCVSGFNWPPDPQLRKQLPLYPVAKPCYIPSLVKNFLLDMFLYSPPPSPLKPQIHKGKDSVCFYSLPCSWHLEWCLGLSTAGPLKGTDLFRAKRCLAPHQLSLGSHPQGDLGLRGRQSQLKRDLTDWRLSMNGAAKPLRSLKQGMQSMQLVIRICWWGRRLETPRWLITVVNAYLALTVC